MMTQTREIAVDTDTALVAQYDELARLLQRRDGLYNRLHSAVSDRKVWQSRRSVWSLTDDAAFDKAERLGPGREVTVKIKETDVLIDLANERIAELDRIWAEYRWNRYFLVTNSNGHVHRGTNCSTCFATTEYAWLIELADCDEDAMIDEFGEKACTVCFPDAPANPKFNGPGRRDREAQDARAAEKAEREAAKNLWPEEQFRNHMGDRVTTVAAAKQALRDEIELKYYYGRGPHNWHPAAVEVARKAREVLLARGSEVAELDAIVARAEKKHARYAGARQT
jgi:hypothetical protein